MSLFGRPNYIRVFSVKLVNEKALKKKRFTQYKDEKLLRGMELKGTEAQKD